MMVDIATLHYWGSWGSREVSAVTAHGYPSCVLAVFHSRQAALDWANGRGHKIASDDAVEWRSLRAGGAQ